MTSKTSWHCGTGGLSCTRTARDCFVRSVKFTGVSIHSMIVSRQAQFKVVCTAERINIVAAYQHSRHMQHNSCRLCRSCLCEYLKIKLPASCLVYHTCSSLLVLYVSMDTVSDGDCLMKLQPSMRSEIREVEGKPGAIFRKCSRIYSLQFLI